MIKLLIISPSYYPAFRFGGPIQSVHLLNKALVKKGVIVDVITTDAGQNENYKFTRLQDYKIDKDGFYLIDAVRVKYLSFVGYEHYNFSLTLVKEIWKRIENYDLVHITAVWNFPVLVGAVISLIKKKPYIISPRGTIYKETIELKSTLFKKLYFNLFAKYYLNKASVIHFTTQDEKDKVTKYLKLRPPSFVVPNGIDLSAIEQQSGKSIAPITDKNYILILGRIDKKKGFDILIPAFAGICKNHNDLKLVIAGDDTVSYAQEVRKIIEVNRITDRVNFTGQVTGDDKWDLYKNALMFVLPSYSENFGMSVVEAMACGCPVVISDKVGIYKEVLENNAGIVVKTDPKSVEEGILRLLNDEKLRITITDNAKAMVIKYYDIDKVAEQMIEQYKIVIGE